MDGPAPERAAPDPADSAAAAGPAPAGGPLSDVRVVEFAQVLAVPTCGLLLADLGADVIKVEPPRGDAYRANQPSGIPREGRAFTIVNRGKRSICIDLAHPDSRQVVERLVRWADVVLVSFKPSDLLRYGLDYAALRGLRPDLIYLENSAYGNEGPAGEDGGYDVVVQGMSGTGSLSSASAGGTPRFVQPAYVDVSTGFLAALGVVSALRHRDRTGCGQRVHTSLLSTALALGSSLVHQFRDLDQRREQELRSELAELRERGEPFEVQQERFYERAQPATRGNVYYRHFRTADGYISVGCLSPALYRKLRAATGLEDPRLEAGFDAESAAGRAELSAFERRAEQLFASRTTATWLEQLRQHGVPCGPFSFPHEVMDDPQVNANGYLIELEHRRLGPYRTFAPPIRFDATPSRAKSAAPALDADRESVLTELGYSSLEIRDLSKRAVVGERTHRPRSSDA